MMCIMYKIGNVLQSTSRRGRENKILLISYSKILNQRNLIENGRTFLHEASKNEHI